MYDNNEYLNRNRNNKYSKYIVIIIILFLFFILYKMFFLTKDLVINYKIVNDKITNTDVIVYYEVNGDNFEKIVLPNGNIVNTNKGSITISDNGTYKLIAYNSSNRIFEQQFVINLIDKEKPTGTCEATLTNVDTQIKVDAHDNNKIVKYEYLDNENIIGRTLSNEYINSGKTSTNIIVRIYDEAGNTNDIKCKVVNNSYHEPILPGINDNVVYQGETDTLKVYIINKGSYYLTRIWAMDAYSQLNKAISKDYGINMYKPKSLLDNEVKNSNLYDKLVIGFNSSGFYLKDTYDASSVSRYPAYDKTSVGTIVINNGFLFRNTYNYAFKQWYIMGIDKDNKMVVFEDNPASTQEEKDNKQQWAQTVINSGIRNTFTFAGPVILNGQKLSSFSTSMPYTDNNVATGMELICQIDENNYALFTSSREKRITAINVFESIGCQTAINLDGGGSTSLLYKDKNSNEFQTILGGARQMPEVGYFTE